MGRRRRVLDQPAGAVGIGRGGLALARAARRGARRPCVRATAGAHLGRLRRPPRRPARDVPARLVVVRLDGALDAFARRLARGARRRHARGRLRPARPRFLVRRDARGAAGRRRAALGRAGSARAPGGARGRAALAAADRYRLIWRGRPPGKPLLAYSSMCERAWPTVLYWPTKTTQ